MFLAQRLRQLLAIRKSKLRPPSIITMFAIGKILRLYDFFVFGAGKRLGKLALYGKNGSVGAGQHHIEIRSISSKPMIKFHLKFDIDNFGVKLQRFSKRKRVFDTPPVVEEITRQCGRRVHGIHFSIEFIAIGSFKIAACTIVQILEQVIFQFPAITLGRNILLASPFPLLTSNAF